MRRLSLIMLAAAWLAGCDTGITIPAGAPVTYENHFEDRSVVVGRPLADRIVTALRGEPHSAQRNVGMGLDTRKYLRVGGKSFQVTGDELILIDDWGVRTWRIAGVEAALDALTVD